MALQTVTPFALGLPTFTWAVASVGALTAAAHRIGWVFEVPETGTITHLTFRTQTVTTSETLRFGLYTLDASGDPTSTQYGSSGYGTQAAPATQTTYEVALGTDCTGATKGDEVAAVIEFDAWVAGSINFYGYNTLVAPASPYIDVFGASWAKSTTSAPLLGIKYSTGAYYNIGCVPGVLALLAAFNSASTPDEVGNRITLPFPCRTSGYWLLGDMDIVADVVLYDTDGTTALKTRSNIVAYRGNTGTAYATKRWATPQTLTAGSTYRVVVKPTSGSGGNAMSRCTVLSAAALDGLPLGQVMHETSRVNAGAWTDTTTQRIAIGLMIDQLDDGVQVGGAIYHGAMGGGLL